MKKMPSITDAINEKYGVGGNNIAEALCQAAKKKGSTAPETDNIADAATNLMNTATETTEEPEETVEPAEPVVPG